MAKDVKTVENQKIILVEKSPADKTHPYAIINLDAFEKAMGELSGNEYKL